MFCGRTVLVVSCIAVVGVVASPRRELNYIYRNPRENNTPRLDIWIPFFGGDVAVLTMVVWDMTSTV